MIGTRTEKVALFFDSGVGGLPYLETAKIRIPGLTLHYLADDAGFPYGTKRPGEVIDLLLDRVRRLRSRLDLDALVIACNTASQMGLSALRTANPDMPIIGTVPAVKPAAASSKTGRIGVLATERTVIDPYIDDLIARYASEVEVIKIPAQDLVEFVERRYLSSSAEERMAIIEPYMKRFIKMGVDRIVLACTHFLHLQTDIAEASLMLGATDMGIVDSREGVARRLAEILDLQTSLAIQKTSVPGRFFLTSDLPFDPSYGLWAVRFGLKNPERL